MHQALLLIVVKVELVKNLFFDYQIEYTTLKR